MIKNIKVSELSQLVIDGLLNKEKIVFTGLPGCGKSQLIGEFTSTSDTYIKCNYSTLSKYSKSKEIREFVDSHQLFDRHPLFDYPVYKSLDDEFEFYQMELDLDINDSDYIGFNKVFLFTDRLSTPENEDPIDTDIYEKMKSKYLEVYEKLSSKNIGNLEFYRVSF